MGAVCGEFGIDVDPKGRRKQRQRRNSGKMWCLIWQESRRRREWIWLIQQLIGENNPWKQEEGKWGKQQRWKWERLPHFVLRCFWWIEWKHYKTTKYKPLLLMVQLDCVWIKGYFFLTSMLGNSKRGICWCQNLMRIV